MYQTFFFVIQACKSISNNGKSAKLICHFLKIHWSTLPFLPLGEDETRKKKKNLSNGQRLERLR